MRPMDLCTVGNIKITFLHRRFYFTGVSSGELIHS